jgi:hypothetical protein
MRKMYEIKVVDDKGKIIFKNEFAGEAPVIEKGKIQQLMSPGIKPNTRTYFSLILTSVKKKPKLLARWVLNPEDMASDFGIIYDRYFYGSSGPNLKI